MAFCSLAFLAQRAASTVYTPPRHTTDRTQMPKKLWSSLQLLPNGPANGSALAVSALPLVSTTVTTTTFLSSIPARRQGHRSQTRPLPSPPPITRTRSNNRLPRPTRHATSALAPVRITMRCHSAPRGRRWALASKISAPPTAQHSTRSRSPCSSRPRCAWTTPSARRSFLSTSPASASFGPSRSSFPSQAFASPPPSSF